MAPTDIAWFAGLLEGEGCFGLYVDKRRPTTCNLKIQLEMTDKDIIDRVQNLFGGRIFLSDYPSKFKNHPNAKSSWRWTVSSKQDVSEIISLVYPYLGSRRKAKCDEILEYIFQKNLNVKS